MSSQDATENLQGMPIESFMRWVLRHARDHYARYQDHPQKQLRLTLQDWAQLSAVEQGRVLDHRPGL